MDCPVQLISKVNKKIIFFFNEKQIFFNYYGFLTRWHDATEAESVASITRQATATRGVIDNVASAVLAASTGTGVPALAVYACAIGRAISVHKTLGPASLIGVARVVRQASARAGVLLHTALGVCSTGRWDTRVNLYHRKIDYGNVKISYEQ